MEKEILLEFMLGSEEAFDIVYNEYFPKIKNICFYYTKDHFLGDEFANQTFMNVWNKRENIRDYRKLEKYLKTTAKNLCIDYLRKSIRNRVDVLDPFIFESTVMITPNKSDELTEKLNYIANIVNEETYHMIVYKYVYNLKHREIAEIMNVTTSVVSNKIARAIKKIKSNKK